LSEDPFEAGASVADAFKAVALVAVVPEAGSSVEDDVAVAVAVAEVKQAFGAGAPVRV
jgi:hypothetical protein